MRIDTHRYKENEAEVSHYGRICIEIFHDTIALEQLSEDVVGVVGDDDAYSQDKRHDQEKIQVELREENHADGNKYSVEMVGLPGEVIEVILYEVRPLEHILDLDDNPGGSHDYEHKD